MPRNANCYQCRKHIREDKLVYFSNVENNLNFCSEECKLTWDNSILNWINIHPDFAKKIGNKTYRHYWEEKGLTYQDAQQWISIGFELWEYDRVINWKFLSFTPQQTKNLRKFGLSTYEYELAYYLKKEGYQLNQSLDLEQLRTKFYTAQNYLDWKYPKNQRNTIIRLDIKNKNLSGKLDLYDFANCEVLDCSFNNLTSLNLANCWKLIKLICSRNQLTNLNYSNCTNLIELNCSINKLTNLDLNSLSDKEKLTILNVATNNLLSQDLSIFSHLLNLEELRIGINLFYGSLKPLQNLTKLKVLDIRSTDIDRGLEYLPESLERIDCSCGYRPNSKVREIEPALNTWLNQNYLKKAEKQEYLIPFSEFFFNPITDLIGQGGFSKLYRAEWNNYRKNWWEKEEIINKTVALKLFIQKIDQEKIWKEITNHRFLDNDAIYPPPIIKCHGLTKDPKDNFYLVLDYANQGNFRNYLKNYPDLNWKNKIRYLWMIINNLQIIHSKKFLHRDFHLGNILISHRPEISDLGLTILMNDSQNNKIAGVLPYMAPEYLEQGKYTSASDIYSFGIMIYEVMTGYFPFYDEDWSDLGQRVVFSNLRPEIKVELPEKLITIIKDCWQADSNKRPNSKKLWERFEKLSKDKVFQDSSEFNYPYQNDLHDHPSVCRTSKWWKIIAKVQNISQKVNIEVNEEKRNEIHFLESKLNSLKETLNEQQQSLFSKFVNTRKEFARNEENEASREKIKSVSNMMKKDISLKKMVKEINKYCDEVVRLEKEIKAEFHEIIEQPAKTIKL